MDVSGNWNPSLILVIASAVAVALIGFRLVLQRSHPLFGDKFYLLTWQDIDSRLIFGAAIFGVGWGIVGYCSGPAIAALSLGTLEPLFFVIALLAGSYLYKWVM